MRVAKPFIALWFILSSFAALATDVVVMRDGSERSGVLSRCDDAQCSLSGKRIPMAEIRAIYLDGPRKEFSVRSSAIVMRDGSVRAGRVTFINRGTVDTDDEEFDRSLVAAVIFSVSSEKAQPDQPGSFGAPPSPPPPPPPPDVQQPPPPPPHVPPPPPVQPPPPPTPPTPRQPNREPVKPCPADRPLGGEIEYGFDMADRTYQRCSGSASLWFRLHPNVPVAAYRFGTTWHSDAITYRLKNDGCTDLPDHLGVVCTAPAQAEVRGRVVVGTVGRAGVEPIAGVDWGPVHFDPFTPELSFKTLPEAIFRGPRTPVKCVNPRGGGGAGNWDLTVEGTITAWGSSDCSNSSGSRCAAACVQPTLCTQATDPEQTRDCSLRPARYAVIPFTGSQTVVCEPSPGTVMNWSFSWKVCCGCGEPPSGPPPDFDPRSETPPDDRNDCTDAASLQAGYAGRLRAYQEMLGQLSPQLGCARFRQDQKLESIGGFSGPLGRWSVALLGLAGELGGGDLATLLGLVSAGLNVAQTGTAGQPGALIELTTSDPAVELTLRQFVPEAFRVAESYLAAHPGDVEGAIRVYFDRLQANREVLGGSAKALAVAAQLLDWKEATEDLCAGISSWQAWKAEAGRLELEHGELTMREREFREKLAAIQTRCPELTPIVVTPPAPQPGSCAETLPEGNVPCTLGGFERSADARSRSGGTIFAAFPAPNTASPASSSPNALVELGSLLAAAEDRIAFEIVPRLAPFMIGEAASMPVEFQRRLLAGALTDLQALQSELGRAVELGREVERALEAMRQAGPDGTPATEPGPHVAGTPAGAGAL